MAVDNKSFSQEIKNRFQNFITDRCGLYFKDHELKNMGNALLIRMESCKIDDPEAYYTYLTTSEKKDEELRELLNFLTINHTYFFRDDLQFKALRERVLPEIIDKKKREKRNPDEKYKIRIWSAGCSTGEEPYSIAMVVRDVLPNINEWEIEIYATDVSPQVLSSARNGKYGKNSMNLVDPVTLRRYFTESNDEINKDYAIQDSIKKMVSFGYLNLMDDNFPLGLDIIFCRNVVIYFELKTTIKIVNKFHSSLLDRGYLFIGYSESLQFITDKFKMEESGGGIFYRAVQEGSRLDTELLEQVGEEQDEILDQFSKAEVMVDEEAGKKMRVSPPETIESILVQIMKLLHLKEYSRALEIIEDAKRIDRNAVEIYYLAGELYVNQGRFDEAKEQLKTALDLNSFFAPAYYLLGSIHIEEKDIEKAKESLKKVLYLDNHFPLAHLAFATVHKIEGRTGDAIREYKNALRLLTKKPLSDIIPYSGGFNAGTLVSICESNIERLKVKNDTGDIQYRR